MRRKLFFLMLVSEAVMWSQSSNAHLLNLIRPDDPRFDALISTFPGITARPAYASMRPFLCFLESKTLADAKAYAIEWTTVSKTGATGRLQKTFVQKHFMPPNAAKVLHASEVRLISPWFSLTAAEYQSSSYLDFLFNRPGFVPGDPQSVTAAVDGIVFSDGVFIGANHAHLLETYVATRHAEHDEGLAVQHYLQGGKSLQEVLTLLDSDIQKGLASARGVDAKSVYLKSRGNEAQALKNLYLDKGFDALKDRTAKMARYPREKVMTITQP